MNKSKLEYIWLDGYFPTANLRSKTKIETNFSGKLEDCPVWSFDGSSTKQAEGGSSDLLLKPVAIYPDPADIVNSTAAARVNGYLGGYGTLADLQAEIDRLGLSPEAQSALLEIVGRR